MLSKAPSPIINPANKINNAPKLNKNLQCMRKTFGQVTLKTMVPAKSPKLSSDEPVQYLDGWAS